MPSSSRERQVERILLLGARLCPDFAHVTIIGDLIAERRERAHHLPPALRGGVATDGQNQQLIFAHAERRAGGSDAWITPRVRDEILRVAAHRQDFDVVPRDAVPQIDFFDPLRGHQHQRQITQGFAVIDDVAMATSHGIAKTPWRCACRTNCGVMPQ